MKIKDLINKLKEFDDEEEVFVVTTDWDDDYGQKYYNCDDLSEHELIVTDEGIFFCSDGYEIDDYYSASEYVKSNFELHGEKPKPREISETTKKERERLVSFLDALKQRGER